MENGMVLCEELNGMKNSKIWRMVWYEECNGIVWRMDWYGMENGILWWNIMVWRRECYGIENGIVGRMEWYCMEYGMENGMGRQTEEQKWQIAITMLNIQVTSMTNQNEFPPSLPKDIPIKFKKGCEEFWKLKYILNCLKNRSSPRTCKSETSIVGDTCSFKEWIF